MSQLLKLVKDYRAAERGISEASVARRAGIDEKTLNSWWRRGRKSPPTADDLRRLASAIRTPYKEVLDAVLHDYGYLPEEGQAHGKPPAEKSGDGDGATVHPFPVPLEAGPEDEELGELSEEDETVNPAADDVNIDDDEKPGGSD